MKYILLGISLAFGFYCIFTSFLTVTPNRLKKAIKCRNNTGLTDVQLLLYKATVFLSSKIKLKKDKKELLEKNLSILNSAVSPEFYTADCIVTSLFYSTVGLMLMIFSIPFGIFAFFVIFIVVYQKQRKKLKNQLRERKENIEKELPQFAGTIRQELTLTRDIVTILSSYGKICGVTLKGEITKTINDIKTTNTVKALQGLERRIGSSKLSEVVRGLIGVYHGEEQTMFFEMLTEDLVKAQTEVVVRELEKRPNKLSVNFIIVAVTFLMMAFASILGDFNSPI